MDKDRQFRILVAPFFLFASLLWAAYLDGHLSQYLHASDTTHKLTSDATSDAHEATISSPQYAANSRPAGTGRPEADNHSDLKPIISFFGVLGVSTLPVGYGIGVVTLCFLRFCSPLFKQKAYDVPLSDTALGVMKTKLKISSAYANESKLSLLSLFDQALVAPSVHQWLFRRWTSFNICAQCVTALLISTLFARALHLHFTWTWGGTIFVLTGFLVWQARASWQETRAMFDLIVHTEAALRKQRSA